MSDFERSAEDKMVVIQEEIGDGLKTGALSPDQSHMYLASLKDIRTEYVSLEVNKASREDRDRLQGRLDVLGEVINRALSRTQKIEGPTGSFWERIGNWAGIFEQTKGMEEPSRGNRIVTIQRRIDNGRISGGFSLTQGSEFQARLDAIRSDYLRLTQDGRSVTYEEGVNISGRLDSLESDLNHLPQF
jgi:hypothetical protein